MKFAITKLLACLILAGVINATVIEPAFCFLQEDAASQQKENGQCCAICHPAQHQGILPQHISPNFTADYSVNLVKSPQFTLSESPARSIFHPPLVL